ncbi:MAG: hypothetical protein ACXVB0_06805 [Mucilaginibacter sp.]
MKKLLLFLLALNGMQALAQKSLIDSLQVNPEKLFANGNILNCVVSGPGNFHVFRFLFSGYNKVIKASLKHELTTKDYSFQIENDAWKKEWDYSQPVSSGLREWTFDILSSANTFKFNEWSAGVQRSEGYYSTPQGLGHFIIYKGLDTSNYKNWKIFRGSYPMAYDSVKLSEIEVPVNFSSSPKQTMDDANALIKIKVYHFFNADTVMGIGQWGNLFFPLYYGTIRNKEFRYQYKVSSVQIGF